jgi:hypothetical protein
MNFMGVSPRSLDIGKTSRKLRAEKVAPKEASGRGVQSTDALF